MNIGEAAARSRMRAKTIRYYESVGLIPLAPRGANGYRDYEIDDVRRLRFIQRGRRLGFSVAEVQRLLDLYADRNRASAHVKALAMAHIADIDRKIAELESMRRTVADLAAKCHGDERPDCPILDDLADDGEER